MKRLMNELGKLEIEDHGFDFSLNIYQVFRISKDGNDILEMSYIQKEDAINFIETMGEEESKKYYWKTILVWFNL